MKQMNKPLLLLFWLVSSPVLEPTQPLSISSDVLLPNKKKGGKIFGFIFLS